MRRPTIEQIELDMKEIEALLERVKSALGEADHETLEKLVRAYLAWTRLIEDEQTTMRRLRKLLGAKSEKTRKVLERAGLKGDGKSPPAGEGPANDAEKKKRKGHGRNGADAYPGAKKIAVPHDSLKPGDPCPTPRCRGTLYQQKDPGVIVRVVGQVPLDATVYEPPRLRCNRCGQVFTAEPAAGVGEEKYDATAAAMIGLLRYGSGLPFNRLERLQRNFGIPLPDATQWDIVEEAAAKLLPVYQALLLEAAQGEVVCNDDTGMKILELMKERRAQALAQESSAEGASSKGSRERTGIFTTGIVSTRDGRKIVLFFTGKNHAGENLAAVLAKRAEALGPPIQMCDALSRNLPKDLKVIVANCVAHGRRYFVDQIENFPDECLHVLEQLRKVYENEALAKARKLSPEERLLFHQQESGPVMDKLHTWFTAQFEEKKVEPNSGLGQAITYMQNHWAKLTLFLRVAGAPLDNNAAERALKKAILHRRNSLFYKTQNGADVGDLFMTLIYTAELSGSSPFDYLTALIQHAGALPLSPRDWFPWDYRETVAKTTTS